MSAGKVIGAMIGLSALAAGIGIYYTQVYAFYDRIAADAVVIKATPLATGTPEPLLIENAQAIDSTSSPVRYRACFTTPISTATLTETYAIFDDAVPLTAPGWFDCFDAAEIGTDLQSGKAIAFMGVENIEYGIDRVFVVYPDGRGYAWNQLNECGEVVFSGKPAPDGCPPIPETN